MSIGLTNALNTYKVPTSAGNALESSREINPYNVVCYKWNGIDTSGRESSANAFATKTSGCNSSMEMIGIENALRPKYIEFMNGGNVGIGGSYNTGVNQITTDMSLPSNNPMALPDISMHGNTGNLVSKPVMRGNMAEGFAPTPVAFGFGMATKAIRESYVGGIPQGNFGIGMGSVIRAGGGRSESFTETPARKITYATKLREGYVADNSAKLAEFRSTVAQKKKFAGVD